MANMKEILEKMEGELEEAIKLALLTAKENNRLREDDLDKIYSVAESASIVAVNNIEGKDERDEMLVAHLLATVKLLLSTAEVYINQNGVKIVEAETSLDVEKALEGHKHPPENMYL